MSRTLNIKNKYLKKLFLKESLISSEQIRIIRSNIEREMTDIARPCFMVTSPNADDQRSLIAGKLAASFAEKGRRVLIVDANLRKPVLHQWFNLSNDYGLTTMLQQSVKEVSFVKRTVFPDLFLLTAGCERINLFHQEVMKGFELWMKQWKREYDAIILETPPFLKYYDGQMLANQADGVIVVVKEHKTKIEDAVQTRNSLERANKKILGVIYQTV
ncbi:CpsD/CapB family tyrosine-protein kinase [Alteribacillus sp. HJP-4]|uniref:CpsD/CapB family tyrosine-protein kinase n=1 Tax=Alteribacillus sp. HJP-4 TaxID=2775394 RepID=UPI0035CCF5E6